MNFGEILIYLNPLLVLSAIYFGYKNIRHNDSNNKNFDTLLYVILGNHTLILILLTYYFMCHSDPSKFI